MRPGCIPPLATALCMIMVLFILISGCTTVPGPGDTGIPAQSPISSGTTPVTTNPVIVMTVIQTLPTEPIRTIPTDTGFFSAYDASQAKILRLMDSISNEFEKNSTSGNISPDYNALGSYSRQLAASADEEIREMQKFREVSDPANESKKTYYISYLGRLKPFASNLETGAALAQKKEYSTALRYFSNANNDLALLRSQELPGHLLVIDRIKKNFGPFIDALQQQANYAPHL